MCPVCVPAPRCLFTEFLLDAAWAHRMWRRALQRVQATLMGPSGSTWLALRSAEQLQSVRHEAFCHLHRERRISCNARSLPGMYHVRDQPLANAEAAYLRAARYAEECRHRCRQARALAAPSSRRRDAISQLERLTRYRRQRHHRAREREAAGPGSQGAASSESAARSGRHRGCGR
jgi:hypothetical protein